VKLEQAQKTVKWLVDNHKAFRPIGLPELTTRGARVLFAEVAKQDLKSVSGWFADAGVTALFVGKEVRGNGVVCVAEWKE